MIKKDCFLKRVSFVLREVNAMISCKKILQIVYYVKQNLFKVILILVSLGYFIKYLFKLYQITCISLLSLLRESLKK